jgi:hypothetical protein
MERLHGATTPDNLPAVDFAYRSSCKELSIDTLVARMSTAFNSNLEAPAQMSTPVALTTVTVKAMATSVQPQHSSFAMVPMDNFNPSTARFTATLRPI